MTWAAFITSREATLSKVMFRRTLASPMIENLLTVDIFFWPFDRSTSLIGSKPEGKWHKSFIINNARARVNSTNVTSNECWRNPDLNENWYCKSLNHQNLYMWTQYKVERLVSCRKATTALASTRVKYLWRNYSWTGNATLRERNLWTEKPVRKKPTSKASEDKKVNGKIIHEEYYRK